MVAPTVRKETGSQERAIAAKTIHFLSTLMHLISVGHSQLITSQPIA